MLNKYESPHLGTSDNLGIPDTIPENYMVPFFIENIKKIFPFYDVAVLLFP